MKRHIRVQSYSAILLIVVAMMVFLSVFLAGVSFAQPLTPVELLGKSIFYDVHLSINHRFSHQ